MKRKYKLTFTFEYKEAVEAIRDNLYDTEELAEFEANPEPYLEAYYTNAFAELMSDGYAKECAEDAVKQYMKGRNK